MFTDIRRVEPQIMGEGKDARVFSVMPDKVMDFRDIQFADEQFSMVVFDPPHFTTFGKNSYMGQKYGNLDKSTWKQDLEKGFSECFRVLQTGGFLIFKWNEHEIPLREIIKLSPYKPLFGHPSGKTQKTHWVCFMKIDNKKKYQR